MNGAVQSHGADLVGARVSVTRLRDGSERLGYVLDYVGSRGIHLVLYDGNISEWLAVNDDTVRVRQDSPLRFPCTRRVSSIIKCHPRRLCHGRVLSDLEAEFEDAIVDSIAELCREDGAPAGQGDDATDATLEKRDGIQRHAPVSRGEEFR